MSHKATLLCTIYKKRNAQLRPLDGKGITTFDIAGRLIDSKEYADITVVLMYSMSHGDGGAFG